MDKEGFATGCYGPDGEIVIGGWTDSSSGHDFISARVMMTSTWPNLALDTAYGSGGVAITDLGSDDLAYSMLLEPNGSISLAGSSGASFGLVRLAGATRRLYAQQDVDWNITSWVGTSGNVVQRGVYGPYGDKTVLNADWTSLTSMNGVTFDPLHARYGYQGGRTDPITGKLNFQNRDLDTGTGTWLEADPTGSAGSGDNLYEAMGDNPVGYSDPTGTTIHGQCKEIDAYLKGAGVTGYTVHSTSKDFADFTGSQLNDSGSVTKEILARMVESNYRFVVTHGTAANLDLQVKARLATISFAKQKKYGFGPDVNSSLWKVTNHGLQYLGTNAQLLDALNGLNGSVDSELECSDATQITMWYGIASALGAGGLNGKLPGAFLKVDTTRTDWIPGDAGYVRKMAKVANAVFLGENIIYMGGGQFWGHFGHTVDLRPLSEWEAEVSSWNHGIGAGRTDDHWRQRPRVGLDD